MAKFLKRLSIMQAFAKMAETAVRKPVSTPKKNSLAELSDMLDSKVFT